MGELTHIVMRAMARFMEAFFKLEVVPTKGLKLGRVCRSGRQCSGNQSYGCTGICTGKGWKAYVIEALHVSKEMG